MGKCVMCKAQLIACIECGELFHAKKKTHVYCRPRCRTRRCRRIAEKKEEVLNDSNTGQIGNGMS